MHKTLFGSLATQERDPLESITICDTYQYVTGFSATTHKASGHYTVRCPVDGHDDNHPSCSLNPVNDSWKCFACGAKGGKLQMIISSGKAKTRTEAAEWLKVTSGRLANKSFQDQPALKIGQVRGIAEQLDNEKLTGTYNYTDEKNILLYQVLRYEGKGKDGARDKRFIQRTMKPEGGWKYNLTGKRRVPYKILRVIEANDKKKSILVLEGEKHCDVLEKYGFYATTNAGGTNWDWPIQWTKYFENSPVIFILIDSDKAGRAAGERRKKMLEKEGRMVILVDFFNDRTNGDDVLDWMKEDGITKMSLEDGKKAIQAKLAKFHKKAKEELKAKTL